MDRDAVTGCNDAGEHVAGHHEGKSVRRRIDEGALLPHVVEGGSQIVLQGRMDVRYLEVRYVVPAAEVAGQHMPRGVHGVGQGHGGPVRPGGLGGSTLLRGGRHP